MPQSLENLDILEKIGEGGMGVIYRAEPTVGERDVAVKVLTDDSASDRSSRRKFEREIEAMARLRHPNIVQILDIGRVHQTRQIQGSTIESGCSWFAMEHVSGSPLLDFTWVETDPDERWLIIGELLMHLLDALGHAHARGVIHRDLKPNNVLVDLNDGSNPVVKLLDFGIARAVDEKKGIAARERNTVTGTPKYMAPEQIKGDWHEEGPWTDLYAIGAMTWQLITGTPPFTGDEDSEIFEAHLEQQLPAFKSRIPVPKGLEDWLRRLLAVKPQARFQRSADAAYALTSLLEEERVMLNRQRDEDYETNLSSPESMPTLAEMAETVIEDVSDEFYEMDIPTSRTGLDDMEDFETPPVPENWSKTLASRSDFLRDQGIGKHLFGLRTIPLVDRVRERDKLWEKLKEVHAENSGRAVVLQGHSGTGKTRLAEWMTRRSHELGSARILKAVHSESNTAADGLGPMFGRFFRCLDLSWSEAFKRIKATYQRLDIPESAVMYDAMGMAEYILTGEESKARSRGFDSREEKFGAMKRLLQALARERPLILWLDDIQWGEEAFELTQILLDDSRQIPIYIVLTAQQEAVVASETTSKKLEGLKKREAVDTLRVSPLSEEHIYELVHRTLKVEQELSRKIARRAEGNPLFAIQLVGNLIERDDLETTNAGLVTDQTKDLEIPADISRLWQRQLRKLLDALPDQIHQKVEKSLSIAALLGRTIPKAEWKEICRLCQFSDHQQLLTQMVRLGLADQSDSQWSFTHRMLRQTFLEEILPEEKREQLHSRCADILDRVYTDVELEPLKRRGHHLKAAGRWQEAVDVLMSAYMAAMSEPDYELADRFIQERREATRHLQGAERTKEEINNDWLEARLIFARFENHGDTIQKLAEQIIDAAREIDYDAGLSHGLRLKGKLLKSEGKLEESADYLQGALEQAKSADHKLSIGWSCRELGLTFVRLGKSKKARESYREGAYTFGELDFTSLQTEIQTHIGYTLVEERRFQEARDILRKAMDLAREVGARESEGSAWNMRGEIARKCDDPERARQCYERTIEVWRYAGSNELKDRILVARVNLGLAELQAGNEKRARELFEETRDSFLQRNQIVSLPANYLGLAGCAGLRGDWEAWQEHFEEGRDLTEKSGFVDYDTAWLFERNAEIALDAGRVDLARTALEWAEKHWRQLGGEQKADEIEKQLHSLA
jgi:serine/threonine protein kinase/tetratricopeptide (TPR) repeat protein